jgi:hypothetical protein
MVALGLMLILSMVISAALDIKPPSFWLPVAGEIKRRRPGCRLRIKAGE